jgi:alpha-N-arabinofuranosidase
MVLGAILRRAAIAGAACVALAGPALGQTALTAQAILRADQPGPRIEPEVYGQFAEHLGRSVYDGLWVGEKSSIPNTRGYRNDVLAALKAIHVPVVRWPGGCFADDYHWRDGVGPRDKRPVRINSVWGQVEEDNSFGTHEFMEFAELLGAKTYVAGNVGTGSPQEMSQWVEYMTSPSNSTLAQERRANGRDKPWKLDYLGVGNENWGCGGAMTAQTFTTHYRTFAEFIRPPRGTNTVKIAGGANVDDYNWTETLMAGGGRLQAISLHYYTLPSGRWENKLSATNFDEKVWYDTMVQALRMDELITKHSAIMDKHDPQKRVGLYVDEWGLWHAAEPGTNPDFLYQQNTVRDAVVAASTLNIFHRHAERVKLAAIAQMVNVLQAMILTDKDKMVLTPTYHVFDMYKVFQGATYLPLDVTSPNYAVGGGKPLAAVQASAGRDAAGVVHIGLVNIDPTKPVTVTVKLQGVTAGAVSGRVLAGPAMDSANTFEAPNTVTPTAFTGGSIKDGVLTATLPAHSVTVLSLK